jgi:acetylornithine deacetylase/succinyl-diaminopimelate desuccinylase-like protein
MRDWAFDLAAIAADAVTLAGLPAATGDGSTGANAALEAGIPAVALGCCEGADMHAPSERIAFASIGPGAAQLRAVLAELLELTPSAAGLS